MMTPEQFESACTTWLGEKTPPKEGFAQLIAATLLVFGSFQRELAHEFEVAVSTVSRWAKGTARPHPLLQKQIVRALLRRVKAAGRRAGSSTNPGMTVALAAKGR